MAAESALSASFSVLTLLAACATFPPKLLIQSRWKKKTKENRLTHINLETAVKRYTLWMNRYIWHSQDGSGQVLTAPNIRMLVLGLGLVLRPADLGLEGPGLGLGLVTCGLVNITDQR